MLFPYLSILRCPLPYGVSSCEFTILITYFMVGCSQKEKRICREHPSVKGIPGDPLFPGFKDVRKLYPGPLNYFNNTEPKVRQS